MHWQQGRRWMLMRLWTQSTDQRFTSLARLAMDLIVRISKDVRSEERKVEHEKRDQFRNHCIRKRSQRTKGPHAESERKPHWNRRKLKENHSRKVRQLTRPNHQQLWQAQALPSSKYLLCRKRQMECTYRLLSKSFIAGCAVRWNSTNCMSNTTT